MREMVDFLKPGKMGVRSHPLMDDNLRPEAGAIPPALAGYSELLRQDLRAELTTLNHYGLSGVGCALVDGLFALAGSIKTRGARVRRLGLTERS